MIESNFICVDGGQIQESSHRTITGGQTILEASSGVFVTADRAGNLDMTMPCVEAVGFIDEADVAEHTIETRDGRVTHRAKFYGGGTLQVVFKLDGSFAAFSGEKIRVESRGTLLLVGPIKEFSR